MTGETVDSQPRGKSATGGLRVMLRFLKPYKARLAGALAALLVSASLTLLIGQGLRWFIDSRFTTESADLMGQALLLFLLLVLVQSVVTFTRFYLVSWIGERAAADIRYAVYGHILTLHPGFFESGSSSEIQSRITTGPRRGPW